MLSATRGRAANLVLLVVSLVVSLLLAEKMLRLAGLRPLWANPQPAGFWRYDSLLGWHHQAGAHGVFDNRPMFRINVSINSKGLRDGEHTYARTDGRRRILVLGDSLVWGYGVEQDSVFTEQLESLLPDSDVINAGVSGYGTDQELLWLRSEGVRYRPDLVVLVISGNDADDNSRELVYHIYNKPRFLRGEGGALLLSNVPVPVPSREEQVKHWIFRHSALIFQLKSHLVDRFRRAPEWSDPELFGLTLALVDEIRGVVRDIGARLVVVVSREFADARHRIHDGELLEGLRGRGILTIDLDRTPGYSTETMLLPRDRHWNPAGHRFVAERLAGVIDEQRLLDAAAPAPARGSATTSRYPDFRVSRRSGS